MSTGGGGEGGRGRIGGRGRVGWGGGGGGVDDVSESYRDRKQTSEQALRGWLCS